MRVINFLIVNMARYFGHALDHNHMRQIITTCARS